MQTQYAKVCLIIFSSLLSTALFGQIEGIDSAIDTIITIDPVTEVKRVVTIYQNILEDGTIKKIKTSADPKNPDILIDSVFTIDPISKTETITVIRRLKPPL